VLEDEDKPHEKAAAPFELQHGYGAQKGTLGHIEVWRFAFLIHPSRWCSGIIAMLVIAMI
jgi:hypothetical protein